MTLAEFESTNNGQAVSYDGITANIGQCEQLVCLYWLDVFGFKCPPIPNAYQLWSNPIILEAFEEIPVGQEQGGDVAVFDKSSTINSPVSGHTDIVLYPQGSGFVGFDSNWGGAQWNNQYGQPTAHQVTHTMNDVLGFLRFKGGNMIENEAQNDAVFLAGVSRHADPNKGEVGRYIGKTFDYALADILKNADRLKQDVIVQAGGQAKPIPKGLYIQS